LNTIGISRASTSRMTPPPTAVTTPSRTAGSAPSKPPERAKTATPARSTSARALGRDPSPSRMNPTEAIGPRRGRPTPHGHADAFRTCANALSARSGDGTPREMAVRIAPMLTRRLHPSERPMTTPDPKRLIRIRPPTAGRTSSLRDSRRGWRSGSSPATSRRAATPRAVVSSSVAAVR